MAKKCIVCDSKAKFFIKDNPNDCYCEDCANDQFEDLSYLEKIEENPKNARDIITDEIDAEDIIEDE